MLKPIATAAVTAAMLTVVVPAQAKDLIIAASLPKAHFWVGGHMELFADEIEAATNIRFQRFDAGALTGVGREMDALTGGSIDVAAPLLAPYHEGRFPLSDVTQLPTYGTNAVMVTKAFLKLMDSDFKLKGDDNFLSYEITSKGLLAWPVGTTGAYVISTTGKELRSPDDLRGLPLRAGSALHTIVLEQLGATPVTMPSSQAYEAMSRGTVDGLVSSIGDWKSYSFQELLKYTISGVSLGNWGSYLATTNEVWNKLSEQDRKTWDGIARKAALSNAAAIDKQDTDVRVAAEAAGSKFVDISELPDAMQEHVAKAGANTWIRWIEQTEAKGHPAKATAKLWVELIQEQGGRVPQGVSEYLEK
ncbi:TRAP transporter substrate-binding protein DctP [Alcaligenaceae bacterium]|nr:TRAP transporter substrate-binding protein DctP [Alcaligenaceae bacterium]